MSASRATLAVVMTAVAFRLVFAGFTGLGIDESYMVAASHRFDWSYFDHPLASWWLELFSRRLFGGDAPIVVRLPFVLLSAISSWLLYRLTDRLYGGGAAFWAVAAYSVSPVFSLAFGCWVLPDGPLDAALLAFALALTKAAGIGGPVQPRWWLAAGLFAGLALLSKYNAVLTLAGAGLFVFTDAPARRQLLRWELWAGVLIAALMFSPVLFWNAAHGWASFAYQGGRATGARVHMLAPLTIWGGEALYVLPWIWLPQILLLAGALRRGPAARRGWMLAMLAVIPILLFALIGIWSSTKILYHWATPGYLLLFPLLGDVLARRPVWWRNSVARLTAVLLAGAAMAIAAELQFSFIPRLDQIFPPGKSPFLQAVDWESLRGHVPPGDVVAALRWYDAGKIGYALPGVMVTVFGPAPHEFGISAPVAGLLGRDVLLVATPGDAGAIARAYAPDFRSLAPAPALVVIHNGAVLAVLPTLLGRDLLRVP
jgi:4-amino-4-deoxy-L-arabinose transferase-like glycosyltransferase